jgi:hypothetical protein
MARQQLVILLIFPLCIGILNKGPCRESKAAKDVQHNPSCCNVKLKNKLIAMLINENWRKIDSVSCLTASIVLRVKVSTNG